MSSDEAVNQINVTFSKKIIRIILSRVSQISQSSGSEWDPFSHRLWTLPKEYPLSAGCTLEDLKAYVESKSEELIDATSKATEILLQRGLIIRCSDGTFRSPIPKSTVPQKDEATLPSSSTKTSKESSSSSSSSNSAVANPDNDEHFYIAPNKPRSTVDDHSSSSGEDIEGPKVFNHRPSTLRKRKGKPVHLPRHRQHRRLQYEKQESTDSPVSDDEVETPSRNLKRRSRNAFNRRLDIS